MKSASSHLQAAPGQPRRILVRGVNWLGDAVMTTPALARLRERFPDVHITLLTPEKIEALWRYHPAVNETIPFAAGEGMWAVSRKLRSANFDLALVFPNSQRSGLEVWLAGIPHRIGYQRPWRDFFLTMRIASRPDTTNMHKRSVGEIRRLIAEPNPPTTPHVRYPPTAHVIHEYLHLTAALGANVEPLAPQLVVLPEETVAAVGKFSLDGESIGNRPLFGLNPGAEYGPAKRWPTDRFVAAAREVQKRTNCVWLIFGGKGDVPTTNEIESALQSSKSAVRNLAGRTSLRELMALLKLCRVLLTNDSGPMHVAAALGTPVVVPFGSTSAELTGPGLPGDLRHQLLQSAAPCAPCFLRVCPIDFRCMTEITIKRVVEAVLTAAASS